MLIVIEINGINTNLCLVLVSMDLQAQLHHQEVSTDSFHHTEHRALHYLRLLIIILMLLRYLQSYIIYTIGIKMKFNTETN